MYRCEECGSLSKVGEKENRTTITREVEYENFKVTVDPKTRRKNRVSFMTTGSEIVKEIIKCNDCFKKGENGGN